jgi:DNA-binding PadR family transcriptional regulator
MKRAPRTSGFLGEFEQMVLLAILQAGENAHGLGVLQELDRRTGRHSNRGALYKTLERMEAKGLVDWRVEAGTPERGGRRRRVFRVRPAGLQALRASRVALLKLWEGLGSVLTERGG